MRVPVGITSDDEGTIVVVCDDGSGWLRAPAQDMWQSVAPIPGTEADH